MCLLKSPASLPNCDLCLTHLPQKYESVGAPICAGKFALYIGAQNDWEIFMFFCLFSVSFSIRNFSILIYTRFIYSLELLKEGQDWQDWYIFIHDIENET